MKYIADLHVHSKFSRATAQNMDLENIYISAQLKGVSVIATGDFTHPKWIGEIKKKLEPDENGLYKLKKEWADFCDLSVPPPCRKDVRFVLATEISNIYSKKGRVRKNHNLIFLPDMDAVVKFKSKIDKIGNTSSDGRPILGLDSRNVLEMILETSDRGFLIPAHIWTPWFSLLGSKSGFDSMEECFEDLTPFVFAVESGLSSDPAMNRCVPFLNGITMISSSDAHSPGNIGREATRFNTERSYEGLREAIKTKDPEKFLGTYEFYSKTGKYYLDGHRKCDFFSYPNVTRRNKGLCPKCGKSLTLGVLYRIEELSRRFESDKSLLPDSFFNTMSLADILSDILKAGSKTKKVQKFYRKLLGEMGSELDILHTIKIEKIERFELPVLAKAISRMRCNKVEISPGYDGRFGKVRLL